LPNKSNLFIPDHCLQHFDPARGTWVDLDFPHEVLAPGEDGAQPGWNQFFREFVAAVGGEGYACYPTFRDGVVALDVMEIVRSGRSRSAVPEHPSDPVQGIETTQPIGGGSIFFSPLVHK
jgi:hypothetical protein